MPVMLLVCGELGREVPKHKVWVLVALSWAPDAALKRPRDCETMVSQSAMVAAWMLVSSACWWLSGAEIPVGRLMGRTTLVFWRWRVRIWARSGWL